MYLFQSFCYQVVKFDIKMAALEEFQTGIAFMTIE